ncbi:MAG: phosphate signaling complex protein PhoU [Myxococcota bacterium]
MYATAADQDLEQIRTLFLQMCVRAESMVRRSVRSVVERDAELGRSVIDTDREIDALEVEIDRACLRCLALRQPVGRDLRLVTAVLKVVTDLERIGDLAVNIARRGLELSAGSGVQPHLDLVRMGEVAADMVRVAADAFVQDDPELASTLRARDEEVDQLNRQAFARWLEAMAAHPSQAERALALTSISRHVERIADHAVNVGEMVVFLVEGRDVRHAAKVTEPAV